MSTAAIAPNPAPKPVCACEPLRGPGDPVPWTGKCETCLKSVQRWGYRMSWCPGGHFMLTPPGAPIPFRCPMHAIGGT
jgi:hypothetical protein